MGKLMMRDLGNLLLELPKGFYLCALSISMNGQNDIYISK